MTAAEPSGSGSGDPDRSLALLWRSTTAPRRGPNPTLRLDQIIDRAIEIADTEGLEALSMRRLAESFGFTPMSLYRHVPGKAELLDLMVDTVNRESVIVDDLPGNWREKLTAIGHGEWDLYLRHPWVLRIGWNRPGMGPNSMAAYESALRVVADLGLDDREGLEVLHLLLDFVRGAARTALESRNDEQHSGISNQHWWASWLPTLRRYADLDEYPHISRLTTTEDHERSPFVDGGLEFGLERLLDGVETLLWLRRSSAQVSASN